MVQGCSRIFNAYFQGKIIGIIHPKLNVCYLRVFWDRRTNGCLWQSLPGTLEAKYISRLRDQAFVKIKSLSNGI